MHQISNATIPGFVWAYRFGAGSSVFERLPDTTDRTELLADGSFVWLHLNLVDARVTTFLDEFPGLTEPVRTALTTHETHGMITVDEQMVFGTLVDFQRDFDQDTHNLGWLHFAISDGFIITTRLQPLRSVERARATVEKNPLKFQRPLDIFELLVI